MMPTDWTKYYSEQSISLITRVTRGFTTSLIKRLLKDALLEPSSGTIDRTSAMDASAPPPHFISVS